MNITSDGPKNIIQIKTYFEHGDLYLSPEEYQRENAWNLPQKQLLIDTIFRGLDIPKFYIWRINDTTLRSGYPDGEAKKLYREILDRKRKQNDGSEPYVFEVVDGQQRIRTILEFMDVTPPNQDCFRGVWHPPYSTMKETPMAQAMEFSQMNADQQIKFSESPLTVMVLESATIDEIRDMFLRLQNGTPLYAQEKRDAMGSLAGRAVRQLAEMQFFTRAVAFAADGGVHRQVAAQMILLETKGKIVSCTSRQLDKLYVGHKSTSIDPGVVNNAGRVLKLLAGAFPEHNPHLNQNYALSLYWLASRILETYDIDASQYSTIASNFVKMDVARLEAMNRDYAHEPDDDVFQELSLAMSRGNTGADGISTRHDIIGQYLFEGVELLSHPRLDPNRDFTHEEKLILYHQARGCCQLEHGDAVCGKRVPFDEAAVDHILPHSRGGRTQLANGRIAYRPCNIARGNRDDFDPKSQCHLAALPDGVGTGAAE